MLQVRMKNADYVKSNVVPTKTLASGDFTVEVSQEKVTLKMHTDFSFFVLLLKRYI